MLNYTAFLWVYKYSMTNSKLKNKTVCSRLNCHRKHNIQVFFQVTKWEQQNNTSISGGRKSFSTEYTILLKECHIFFLDPLISFVLLSHSTTCRHLRQLTT